MRWSALFSLGILLLPLHAADPESEPDPEPEGGDIHALLLRLDKVAAKQTEADFLKQRDRHLKVLTAKAQNWEKAGRKEQARELRDRLAMLRSLEKEKRFDFGPKEKVTDRLKKASGEGKYRELLHVLYLPSDKLSYTDFRDYGYWNGNSYGGYADLSPGYWVYVNPHWYIWKEPKP
jgi:hypothetical protein